MYFPSRLYNSSQSILFQFTITTRWKYKRSKQSLQREKKLRIAGNFKQWKWSRSAKHPLEISHRIPLAPKKRTSSPRPAYSSLSLADDISRLLEWNKNNLDPDDDAASARCYYFRCLYALQLIYFLALKSYAFQKKDD